jgi:hypothetical protein
LAVGATEVGEDGLSGGLEGSELGRLVTATVPTIPRITTTITVESIVTPRSDLDLGEPISWHRRQSAPLGCISSKLFTSTQKW